MEFEGRISKVLPTKSGTRQDGSEWKSLPFVFEYYENETDRYPDSVLLETTDHDMMRNIGKFVARGADNKAIIKDGQCELLGEIKCKCAFWHRVMAYKAKDGSDGMMNKIKVNKLEIIPTAYAAGTAAIQPTANAVGTSAQQPFAAQPTQQALFTQAYAQQVQQPFPSPQQQEESDDLPF